MKQAFAIRLVTLSLLMCMVFCCYVPATAASEETAGSPGADPAKELDVQGRGTENKTDDPNKEKLSKAKAKNKDTIGWFSVPGTNIDYPVLYASKFYYATHDINKKKSYEGVYPYHNYLTKNVVIFGHNLRKSGTGFHEMHHMQEKALDLAKCQTRQCGKSLGSKHADWVKENRIWNISIFGKTRWEVFAMYEVKAKEPMSTLSNNWNSLFGKSDEAVQQWLDKQLKRSEFSFDVPVTPKDTFMTIVTCGTNYDSADANSRLFVFLKCVE